MASKTTNTILKVARTILRLMINALFYLIIIYFVANASRIIYDTSYEIFGNTGVTEGEGIDVFIKVEQGESTMNIANKLDQNKVIRNPYSFYIHAKLKDYPIMPGTFTLNTSMNYDQIFEILTVPFIEDEDETEEVEDTEEETEAEEETEEAQDNQASSLLERVSA